MNEKETWDYWKAFYADASNFARLFKDFRELKNKAVDAGLTTAERAQYSIIRMEINGKVA